MYGALSRVYDAAMDDAPYGLWYAFLTQRFHPFTAWEWADVGCGTGTLTRQIAKHGAAIVGVDASEDMLSVAASAAMSERLRVTWLHQDMRDLRIPRPVDILISSTDCLNYLLQLEDVRTTLHRFYTNLKPGGSLVFDVHGPKRLLRLKQGQWHDIRDTQVVVYETDISATGRITYDVHAFVTNDGKSYERFEEHHEQQVYDAIQLLKLLKEVGFGEIECLADFGHSPMDDADRLVFVAKREER